MHDVPFRSAIKGAQSSRVSCTAPLQTTGAADSAFDQRVTVPGYLQTRAAGTNATPAKSLWISGASMVASWAMASGFRMRIP